MNKSHNIPLSMCFNGIKSCSSPRPILKIAQQLIFGRFGMDSLTPLVPRVHYMTCVFKTPFYYMPHGCPDNVSRMFLHRKWIHKSSTKQHLMYSQPIYSNHLCTCVWNLFQKKYEWGMEKNELWNLKHKPTTANFCYEYFNISYHFLNFFYTVNDC